MMRFMLTLMLVLSTAGSALANDRSSLIFDEGFAGYRKVADERRDDYKKVAIPFFSSNDELECTGSIKNPRAYSATFDYDNKFFVKYAQDVYVKTAGQPVLVFVTYYDNGTQARVSFSTDDNFKEFIGISTEYYTPRSINVGNVVEPNFQTKLVQTYSKSCKIIKR